MIEVGGRHSRIVEMVDPVPDAVFILHPHMAHLHGQEIFERRLPDVPAVDIVGNAERAAFGVSVSDDIHARLTHIAEVEHAIGVAQEIAPLGRIAGLDRLPPAIGQAIERRLLRASRRRIQLDDRTFGLPRGIAHLADLDHRFVLPAGHDVRRDQPRYRIGRRPLGHRLAHDVPAIVMRTAPVDEFERPVLADDGHALRIGFGRDGERLPHAERRAQHLAVGILHRPVRRGGTRHRQAAVGLRDHRAIRLAREDAGATVGQPRLAEQMLGKQFEVEADPPQPFLRNRTVEIDRDAKRPIFGRRNAHLIAKIKVGVEDRVEALPVLRRIGKSHCLHDRAGLPVDQPLACGCRHRRPLARLRLQPHIAIRRHAKAMLDHGDARLVTVGVDVVEHDHIRAGLGQIATLRQREIPLIL